MTKRYIVSKTSFATHLASIHGMLDSLGRFASPAPFSHSYQTYNIKRYDKKKPEEWLEKTYLAELYDWMLLQENNADIVAGIETRLATLEISISIVRDRFLNAESFINEHLNSGLLHLLPEPVLRDRLQASNELVAWKIADQLMFLCDNFNCKLPAWRITIKTERYEGHIMAIPLKFGMVFILFHYPTSNHIFEKERIKPLLNNPDFH